MNPLFVKIIVLVVASYWVKVAEPSHVPFDKTMRAIDTIEEKCIQHGLVNIATIDASIQVDLKYSTVDNFLGIDLYGDFNKCYLQPDVAQKLKVAQQYLKSKYPYYSLLVYDAVRPVSIQERLWDSIKVPLVERTKYVSDPHNGSLHNFGAAVDVGIIDESGYELDMGTPFDYFGDLAYPREEERLLQEGKMSYRQLSNREVLREAMVYAGFSGITTEWWHFNSCSRKTAYLLYKIIL